MKQQDGAWVMLRQIDRGQRQAVLDEWDARCRAGKIRHPAAYLFGIVQKALRGKFKVWAGLTPSAKAPDPSGTNEKNVLYHPMLAALSITEPSP